MSVHYLPFHPKAQMLRTLAAWRQEADSNAYGLAYLAPRAIAVIETEIEHNWPGSFPARAVCN